MGDEADRLYGEEIDYMVYMDMLASMDGEKLQTIGEHTCERATKDVWLTSNCYIELYLPHREADDREVFASVIDRGYDLKTREKAANILRQLGFSITHNLEYCELSLENYQRDMRMLLEGIVKYDCRDYKVGIKVKRPKDSPANKCIIRFDRIPLAKYKKRLRDFGFRYDPSHEVWGCMRGKSRPNSDFKDVVQYFEKQEQAYLVWV